MLRAPFPTLCSLALLACFAIGQSARAELPSLVPQQTLSPRAADVPQSPFSPNGQFGHAVAVRGNLALVGMPFGNPVQGSNTGRVATYSRGADGVWKRTGTLTGTGAAFGWTLAFRENIAAIASASTISVFKFQTTTGSWKLLNTIDPGAVPLAVDYQDGRLVVTTSTRALFVYDIDVAGKVVRQTRLTGRGSFSADRFGFDVAMTREIVVVGAPAGQGSTGLAYVFRLLNGQWVQTQVLRPSDGAAGDQFGFSVAIDKGMILVGAPSHQPQGRPFEPPSSEPVASGAVYVYPVDAGRFLFRTKLRPTPDEHPFYAAFGSQIAMFDTKVAIAAVFPIPASNLDDRFSGLVFAYDRVGADLTAFAVARPQSGLRLGGGFGQVVNIFGMTLLAGSPLSQCEIGCVGNAISFDLRQVSPDH